MGIRVLLTAVLATALVAAGGSEPANLSPKARNTGPQSTPSLTVSATESAEPTPGPPSAGLESRMGLDHLLICVEVSPAAAPALRATDAATLVAAAFPSYARRYSFASDTFRDSGAQAFAALKNPEVRSGCPDDYLPPPDEPARTVKGLVT